MKRLFRKDNRIARLIAMWLVFIMALTPFYEHSGIKNPTKAAPGTEVAIDYQTFVADITGRTIEKSVSGTDNVDKVASYKLTAISKPAESALPKIVFASMNSWDTTLNITKQIEGDTYYTDSASNIVTIATSKYDVLSYVTNDYNTISTEFDNNAPLQESSAAKNGDYYAIYVKLKDDAISKVDSEGETGVSNTTWTLQDVYEVQSISSLYSGNLWIDGEGNSANNKVVQSAKLNQTALASGSLGEKDKFVGQIAVFYKKTTNTTYDSSIVDKLDASTVLGGTGQAENGYYSYYAWAAYSYDGGTSYHVFNSTSNDKVTVDSVAPTLVRDTDYPLLQRWYKGSGNLVREASDGNKFYVYADDIASGEYYRYHFKLSDNNTVTELKVLATSSSEVLELTATTTQGGSIYIIENFAKDMDAGQEYVLTVVLKDSADNKSEEITLDTVKVIDPNLKITGNVTDGTTPVEFSGDCVNDPYKNVTLPVAQTNKLQTVTATITSGYKITAVKVDAQDGNNNNQVIPLYDKSTDAYTNASYSGGLYTYNLTFTLPENEGTDRKYNNIVLTVTDENSKTVNVNFGNLVYDYQPPVLTADGIYKWEQDENGNWLWKKVERENGTLVISTDPANTDKYKFVFNATDPATGTGVNRVEYYYSQEPSAAPIGNLDVDGNTYYKEFSNSELLAAMGGQPSLILSAKAFDNVGNSSDFVAAPLRIVAPIMQLSAEAVLYKQVANGDGTYREEVASIINGGLLGDGSYESNKQYILRVSASSGYLINSMIVKDGTGATVATLGTINQEFNVEHQRYYTKTGTENYVDILLPEGTSVNTILSELDLVVGDGTNPDMVLNVGTLLYDKTNPELFEGTFNGVDALSPFGVDDKWYTASPNVAGTVMPGPQLAADPESAITDVSYSITNNVGGDVTDVTDSQISVRDNMGFFAISVPESKTASGTKLSIKATDKAGNALDTVSTPIVKLVDLHDPYVTDLKVNGLSSSSVPFEKNVQITANVNDNLSLKKTTIEVVEILDDGTTGKVYTMEPVEYALTDALKMDENSSSVSRSVSYPLELPDGEYRANVRVFDKAGRGSAVTSSTFTVDSTAPVVDAAISAGTAGKTDYFYKSNVTVALTCTEKHSADITVTDNGTPVSVTWKTNSETGVKEGTYTVSTDGLHTVKIEAKDGTGNAAIADSVAFIKDTKVPVINAMLNGAINYSESDGVRVFTANTTLAFSEKDDNKDANGFYYQMTKTVPDETPVVGKSDKTPHRSFSYTDEAEYTVNVYSVDMANNVSATKTVRFRIDKTAPSISIGGIGDGGSSSNPVTVSLNMQELYWSDATGTVEIYMKSGEGFGEELIEEIPYTPTGRNTSISRSFAESGIYRIEFNAQDSAGHTATTSSSFTIDTEVPVVTLEGVANYDVTDKDVTISSTITDKFYASKKVTITGSVTDDTGKVTPLTIDNYSATANPTVINETFSEDGIYDLTITCVDIVGNTDSKSVHFIIDKSDPVIGDLSDYEDKILTSFVWDKDLDELVSDLTVCDVHMYLNGQEYNGEDAVEDGSYILLITAEDELGHLVEKEVKFTLDTKAPVFIVTGVEDEESRIEPYNISVSLQLEEDTLTSVTLNDKVVTINGNTATFSVTEIGEYKLYMEAVDEAGNVSSAEYEFELEAEKEFNFGIIIAIAAVLLMIILFLIIRSRSKKK